MTVKARLYAKQIERRIITILDVDYSYRDDVLSLLSEAERKRQEALLEN